MSSDHSVWAVARRPGVFVHLTREIRTNHQVRKRQGTATCAQTTHTTVYTDHCITTHKWRATRPNNVNK